jgi:hypothetical protein
VTLEKPTHLGVADGPWLGKRMAAVAALALGILSFFVVAIVHGAGESLPPAHVSVPGLALTALAAGASLWRREPGAYPLWLLGLAAALVAVVLGWFLMIAVVVGAAAVLIVILHAVM